MKTAEYLQAETRSFIRYSCGQANLFLLKNMFQLLMDDKMIAVPNLIIAAINS